MTNTKENASKMMTVKTGYARIALMLMAVNLLMTGYAISALADIHQTTYGALGAAQNKPAPLQAAPTPVENTPKTQD